MNESSSSVLSRIWDYLEEWTILLLLAYMTISLNVEVVSRHIFSASSPYTGEMARICLIWIVFLGVPYAIRHQTHVVIDIISSQISQRSSLYVTVISSSIFALFCLVFASLGIVTVVELRDLGVVTNSLEMPKWIAYLCIPIGAALSFFRLVQIIKRHLIALSRSSDR